jgi:U6 snRNA-associated Sm-like protein LSm4
MLPLGLLNLSQNHPILVELKSGATFNGHLVNCDNFMNLVLKQVIQTSPDGERFFKMSECYIRGNTIKYLRVPEQVMDVAKEEAAKGRGNTFNKRGQASRGQRARGMVAYIPQSV